MQFGLFYQLPQNSPQTHAERYAEMLDLIGFAESLGFDIAWLAEIHFSGAFSLLSVPLMVAPVIAQQTQRIRIGTAVTVLPLQNPLSYAEQVATADLLSGGRLEFGIGRGSIPTQFHGFGVPMDENRARFDEALDLIRLAWTEERFSYQGRFYQAENLSVVPKPVQQPHPPLRVAVHSLASFTHIGNLGLPIYSGTTTSPLPEVRQGLAIYRERLAAHGHAWNEDQFALMLPLHVATTTSAARDAMRPGVEKFYRNLIEIFSHLPPDFMDNRTRLQQLQQRADNLPFEQFCQDHAVFAEPSACIDRLQAIREEFDLSQIICWFDQGCMLPVDEVKRCMALFADTVMPKLS
ncbi:MAG: LLM class flavin-dependent oxidoreductase [bacterium]|jgi:alkanesulfonate monooxygenase SsuD/methylene tetrahydromethanopterin reductase-like flavin-dependent oxidoreductase (luciferase family)|nr:LLM class flavin-dependent oxidoreductase [bacterium]